MMCDKKSLRGWDHISPPLTPEELLAKCKALRKKIEQDIEEEKKRQEMIKEHEYMGVINGSVR